MGLVTIGLLAGGCKNEVIPMPGLAAARVNLLGFSVGGADQIGRDGLDESCDALAGAVAMAFAKRFPERVWAPEGPLMMGL